MRTDLAEHLAAGSVVVTPNRRLAVHLKREFDFAQVTAGRKVWRTADCLPLTAFVERTHAELARLLSHATLLTPQQELALWERVVAESPGGNELLGVSAAARAAREAWAIQHAQGIEPAKFRPMLDEDSRNYVVWAERFDELVRSGDWLDTARLPDAVIRVLEGGTEIERRALVFYGFDRLTPQLRRLAAALAGRGWSVSELGPERRASDAHRTACDHRAAEFTVVAQAVRAVLAAEPLARVGIVVPDLAAARSELVRILDDVLEPARILAATRERARPYNISLGLPLARHPLIHTAFLLLELARGELRLEDMGSLLRSPFLAGAERELACRALLDAKLRSEGRPFVSPRTLASRARGAGPGDPASASELAARLASWVKLAADAKRAQQAPSQWSVTFQRLLSAAGWPGERALDSDEYQTLEKWREVVSSLSVFDAITPRFAYDDALARLKRLAADTLFEPESADVPIQVLGVLEANALEFDRLFVTGLTDETWPPPAHPNPFLPYALQRAHEVPHATADWQLQYARRTTELWLGAAPLVQLSWPRREGDRELRASMLLAGIRDGPRITPATPSLSETIRATRMIEMIADFSAPPLPPGVEVAGGASFFQNQAACAFRAFAIHRLGARELDAASDGLDANDRGWLVHRAAESLWKELGDSARLAAAGESDLRLALERAVTGAIDSARRRRPDVMSNAYCMLERERVMALLSRLLELERRRASFAVLARENPRPVSVAGVKISTRLDRIDRLADGSIVILDYKTSRQVDVAHWLGERPDEPQLPLYAASSSGEPAAVAYVQLHAQQVRFEGLSRVPDLLPGVPEIAASRKVATHVTGWKELLDHWRRTMEALASDYRAGGAEVAPKDYPRTCAYCALGTFCRVKEFKDRGPVAEPESADE